MSFNKDRAQEKIKKLLAMAHDCRGNKNEAEAALRQAEALMRKHGIDEADVMLAGLNNGKMETAEEVTDIGRTGTLPLWINLLSCGIAKFTDTVFRTKFEIVDKNSYRLRVVFCGETSDAVVASWLLRYLIDAVTRERKRDGVPSGAIEGHSYRRAAAGRLQDRMYSLRKERDIAFAQEKKEGTATGFALVVVQKKLAKIEEIFGKLDTESTKVHYPDANASILGTLAGNRINLNQQIEAPKSEDKLLLGG